MAAIGLEIFFGPMTGAAFGRTEYVRPTGLKTDLELKRLFSPGALRLSNVRRSCGVRKPDIKAVQARHRNVGPPVRNASAQL